MPKWSIYKSWLIVSFLSWRPSPTATSSRPGFLCSCYRDPYPSLSNCAVSAQMEKLICPSSPASAGFFCVKKKEGTLRPCINNQGLNKIIIKDHRPLPLMSTGLDYLSKATIFTHLNLQMVTSWSIYSKAMSGIWHSALSPATGHTKSCSSVCVSAQWFFKVC